MEDDASLGLGQLPVPLHQLGVLLVEDAAGAVGPQGVDVVPGGGFEAMVERGDRTPGGCRRGFRGHRRRSVRSAGGMVRGVRCGTGQTRWPSGRRTGPGHGRAGGQLRGTGACRVGAGAQRPASHAQTAADLVVDVVARARPDRDDVDLLVVGGLRGRRPDGVDDAPVLAGVHEQLSTALQVTVEAQPEALRVHDFLQVGKGEVAYVAGGLRRSVSARGSKLSPKAGCPCPAVMTPARPGQRLPPWPPSPSVRTAADRAGDGVRAGRERSCRPTAGRLVRGSRRRRG